MLLVSRSSSTATYHHGNLQAALEDAALSLLETQPAAKISLREVARRAGVSHNAPYNHFGDRAALLHALGVRAMRELLEAQERAVDAAADPVDRVRALGRRTSATRPSTRRPSRSSSTRSTARPATRTPTWPR